MFTATGFVTGLGELEVTGVKTCRVFAPRSFNAAEFPLSYARLPAPDMAGVESFTGQIGLRSVTAELVVVVEALGLNTQPANMAAALALLDGLHTALTANVEALGIDAWQIRADVDTLGDVAYWTLVASVEASG